MGSILAKKIFQNEHLVFNRPGLSSINGNLVNNTPTIAWLVRNPYCCGGDEELQLEFEDPGTSINTIKGVYIQMGADGFLIDGNIDDVNAKLGGCCGDDATITQNYPTGLPAWVPPFAKSYTLVRFDDGTIAAAVQAELDYSGNQTEGGNVLPNSFTIVSRNSGTGATTYSFKAYIDPKPQGTDTITQGSTVYSSNVYATALTGSNVFRANGSADSSDFDVKGTAQTLASLVTALNADSIASTLGTWTAGTNQVILTSTHVDNAVITLGQVAP